MISETDLDFPRRAIALAKDGDMPFGSLLVAADGMLLEDRNREHTVDGPALELEDDLCAMHRRPFDER